MKQEPQSFDYRGKRAKHMAERYEQHRSLRKTAEEFGVGKSTVHRALRDNNWSDEDD